MDIIVRAWSDEEEKMIYSNSRHEGYDFGLNPEGVLKCYINYDYCDSFGDEHDDWVELDNLMLSTGRLDRDKKRIFDRDLVEIEYYSYEQPECSAIFEVEMGDFGFELKYISGDVFESPYTEIWRVIGNSYENSELLS